MNLTLENTLWLSRAILCGSLILQALENLALSKRVIEDKIWSWGHVKDSVPGAAGWGFFLQDSRWRTLLWFQMFLPMVLLLYPHFLIWALLLFLLFLLSLRFRGSFNGGSDAMTALLVLAHLLISVSGHHPKFLEGVLWYLSLQTVFSFAYAGWVKLRESEWRSGKALKKFLRLEQYSVPESARFVSQFSWAFAWIMMLFEISFPLALFHGQWSLFFISTAIVFHLINFFVFGLNRFVWAWLAAYPILFWCAQHFTSSRN